MVTFVSLSINQDGNTYLHSYGVESAVNLVNGLRSDTMYSITSLQESFLRHILAIRVWKFNVKESFSNQTELIF